jgi:hypothetical protein
MPQINQFTNAPSAIAEADYLGFEQDVGGGAFVTSKIRKGQANPIFLANLNGVDVNMQELFIQKLLWVPTHIQDASWWNAATKRYTPLRPGYYQVNFTASYKSIIAGLVYIASNFLYKNNALVATAYLNSGTFVNPLSVSLSAIVFMNGTTDFMDFRADFLQPRAGART